MSEDTGYAPDAWAFDEEVTRVFDNMLERSVPQYEIMRDLATDIASQFQQEHTDIVDLGCSRGGAIAPLVERFGAHNRYFLCDVSEPMLNAARQRFAGYLEGPFGSAGLMRVESLDLRHRYPPVSASVTLCVLTLQFTPIEYRQRIVRDIYKHTAEGGVLILVEKVLGASAELDKMLVELYHEHKRRQGYTQEQIERKKLSLEGKLVPVTAAWNEELLRMAGFSSVDCFWRCLNFAGWVAQK